MRLGEPLPAPVALRWLAGGVVLAAAVLVVAALGAITAVMVLVRQVPG